MCDAQVCGWSGRVWHGIISGQQATAVPDSGQRHWVPEKSSAINGESVVLCSHPAIFLLTESAEGLGFPECVWSLCGTRWNYLKSTIL